MRQGTDGERIMVTSDKGTEEPADHKRSGHTKEGWTRILMIQPLSSSSFTQRSHVGRFLILRPKPRDYTRWNGFRILWVYRLLYGHVPAAITPNLLPSCSSVLHSLPSVTHYVPRSGWWAKVGAKNRTKNQTRWGYESQPREPDMDFTDNRLLQRIIDH